MELYKVGEDGTQFMMDRAVRLAYDRQKRPHSGQMDGAVPMGCDPHGLWQIERCLPPASGCSFQDA